MRRESLELRRWVAPAAEVEPPGGWRVVDAIVGAQLALDGTIVMFSPLSATAWLMIFGACALVVIGISAIIRAFTFGRRAK